MAKNSPPFPVLWLSMFTILTEDVVMYVAISEHFGGEECCEHPTEVEKWGSVVLVGASEFGVLEALVALELGQADSLRVRPEIGINNIFGKVLVRHI